MNEFLNRMLNQEVEIVCASTGQHYKGRIKACAAGIITLEKDNQLTYIAADKVVAITPR